jgi:AraC-like DNA-binding protein/mannose-6-phosphate isomerase-like protein (cupin superfamily)
MRQAGLISEYDPPAGVAISTLEYEYEAGFEVPRHAHGSDQLIYAISGVMEVSSESSTWVIPPQFGLWIPAGVPHNIRMPRAVSMRTLYIRKGQVSRSGDCSVLHVSPLLRELIVEAVRLRRIRLGNAHERALRELIVTELERANLLSTFVTLPRERLANALARSILADPARPLGFKALCAEIGVGVRTMQRLFQRELGCDFDSWRRQVRITKAVELLASGLSVKEVSYQVGYSQPSAFIEAFRRMMGLTPKSWVKSLDRH